MNRSHHPLLPWSVGMAVAFAITVYCLMGIVMVVDFAGAPGYSHTRAVHDANMWGVGTIIGVVAFVSCAVARRRTKRAVIKPTQPEGF